MCAFNNSHTAILQVPNLSLTPHHHHHCRHIMMLEGQIQKVFTTLRFKIESLYWVIFRL